jgi:hypothetical protein
MGYQAKILRSTIRMTKFLRNKWKLRTALTLVVLPSIDIMPVMPKLSIMHIQSTTVPSQTQPSPSTVQYEQQHDSTYAQLDVKHAQHQQKAELSPANDDILTQSTFFEIMENFQKELFKPP